MNAANDLETVEVAKAHVTKDTSVSPNGTAESFSEDEFDHPTDEELATLRRVSGQIPWAAYTIAFVEMCERFSYYGTTAVCK